MPSLDVTLPELDVKTRAVLAEKLTDVLTSQPGFDRDIFGICFHEYALGKTTMAGKLWDGTGEPFLHIVLSCPRLNRATKQNIVRGFTKVFTESLQKPDWKPIIHISEHSYDNIGVNGELLSDLIPELADRKFYYKLPK
jgi:phenylpyruvate tautomerase PptA (4-oxalocrotonate tautomerase family)